MLLVRKWKWVFYLAIVKNSLYHWKQWINTHANASGFSIKNSDIDKLCEYANTKLADINFNEGFYEADFVIHGNYSEITPLVLDIGAQQKLWG